MTAKDYSGSATTRTCQVVQLLTAGCLLMVTSVSSIGATLVRTLDDPNPRDRGHFGHSIALIDDSSPKIVIGAYGYPARVYVFSVTSGALLLTIVSPDQPGGLGWSVAVLDDIDGDGNADILVGAPFQDVNGRENQGRAYVFSGASGSLIHRLEHPNPQTWANFGYTVAASGDLDGDNVSDILVGAPYQDVNGREAQGRAYVFSGASGTLIRVLDDPQPHLQSYFGGFSFAKLPDLDNDQVSEIAVGAPGHDVDDGTTEGNVFVLSGASGAELGSMAQDRQGFGSSIDYIGDVNIDGKPDILVGAFTDDGWRGSVYLYADTEEPGDWNVLHHLANPDRENGYMYGWHVVSFPKAGERRAPRFAIAAPFQHAFVPETHGQVFIYNTSNARLLETINPPNPQDNMEFGMGVVGFRDTDGDHTPDIAIGAPQEDVSTHLNQGRVYVFSTATPLYASGTFVDSQARASLHRLCREEFTSYTSQPRLICSFRNALVQQSQDDDMELIEPNRPGAAYSARSKDELAGAQQKAGLYQAIKPLVLQSDSKPLTTSEIEQLAKAFKAQPNGHHYSSAMKSTLEQTLSGAQDLDLESGRELVKAINAIELDGRAPSTITADVEARDFVSADLQGLAWVALKNVKKGGKLTLKLESPHIELPTQFQKFAPVWPFAVYELGFNGALDEAGYLDVSIEIGDLNVEGRARDLRLIELNGNSARDITSQVDVRRGVITGRTSKLARYILMTPQRLER